ISGSLFINVNAESNNLNPQQIEQVRSNCVSIKNTINQLHVSDALLRVNMGQRYELVSTKLMERFNVRLTSNGLKIDNLISVSEKYKVNLNKFRDDYKIYEESLSSAIRIDCQSQPSELYDVLMIVRDNRQRVYEDVKQLVGQIDQYRAEVDNFETSFRTARGQL
ncbi:MAG: hypothetical protein WCQ49_03250, partial [Candidatus Saccharibacteria bacterium]